MRQFKTLRTISLLLGFALAVFGCATSKNQAANGETGVQAVAVPEGIRLTFNTIPPETKRLFIHFQYSVNEGMHGITNIVSSFSDLRDSSLAQVKQTGNVIFPVVAKGCTYHISVIFQNEDFEDILDWKFADCIADKGIYVNNNVSLDLNETHSAVTLSGEPIFSSDVTFDDTKYDFAVTIQHYQNDTESGSIGVGNRHVSGVEGLTWTFDPEMTAHLREGRYMESGSYPAYVTARCNIIYNNIKWSVEIAKTPEFTYTL